MTSYRSTSVPPFWPDKSPGGLDVFKWFMLTKGSTIVFFRRANPKRCRIVNVATIWVGFLTFYCSIFLGFDCGKANVINQKWGMVFQSPKNGQPVPGFTTLHIYMWYIYIYDICIWYIYIYDHVIYWSPRSSPRSTSLAGTWKKAEPSEVRHQARPRRVFSPWKSWGFPWEFVCDFNGNTMISQGELGLSENSVPLNPMVFMIIIPMKNGYFIGNINPTFSDKPNSCMLSEGAF